MVRLIDADALKQITEESIAEYGNDYYTGDMIYGMQCVVYYATTDAPAVDAVPVRHGKWIIRDNPGTGWYRITCSECGEDVTSTAPCIGLLPNAKVTWDYCPNCGARMDADETD